MVTTDNFIKDTVIFVRDNLRENLTDPISTSRGPKEKFVYTSYPKKNVRYPIITVTNPDIGDLGKLGMQSQLHYVRLTIEIRMWARNVVERDKYSQDIINQLRNNQFNGIKPSTDQSLYGFGIDSAVNVSEGGEQGPKSKVIQIHYDFVLGS